MNVELTKAVHSLMPKVAFVLHSCALAIACEESEVPAACGDAVAAGTDPAPMVSITAPNSVKSKRRITLLDFVNYAPPTVTATANFSLTASHRGFERHDLDAAIAARAEILAAADPTSADRVLTLQRRWGPRF